MATSHVFPLLYHHEHEQQDQGQRRTRGSSSGSSGSGSGITVDQRATRVVRVGKSAASDAATVAAGLALLPDNATARWTLQVEPGIYRERVSTINKGPVSIIGLGALDDDVLIVFGCSNNVGTGRLGCMPCPSQLGFNNRATLTIASDDFIAANLSIANDACGYNAGLAGQSDAVSIDGDRASFRSVRFLGGQDTLYTGNGTLRSYFYRSFINGSCDSIYGDSSSVFEECNITVVDHVTAHGGGSRCTSKANGGRSPGPDQMCGADGHGDGSFYLFLNSSFLKPDVTEFDHKYAPETELGRAWGSNAHVILKETFLDDHIAPHGWGCMASSKILGHFPTCSAMCSSFGPSCSNSSKCYCQNTTFAEHRSYGPGANPSKRVSWSKQLTDQEADTYSLQAALRGWTPPPSVFGTSLTVG